MSGRAGATAAFGALVWSATAPFIRTSPPEIAWVERFVLLAVLVLAPLVLGAMGAHRPTGARLDAWWLRVHPFAAVLVAVSFVLAPGPLAAALVVPWLAMAGILALAGLVRLLTLVRVDAEEAAFASARLFLPVGAVWLLISRSGQPFLGFHEPLPVLTAVHFHYTAFAAIALAGLLARVQPGRHIAAIVALAAVGTPVTAAGITLQNEGHVLGVRIALVGAVMVVAAFVLLAAASLLWALRARAPTLPRALLVVSSLLGLTGVPWGAVWAWDQAAGGLGLGVLEMVRWHGAVNAAGFVLPALVAWTLLAPAPTPKRSVRIHGAAAAQDRGLPQNPPGRRLPEEAVWSRRVDPADLPRLRRAVLHFDVGLPGKVRIERAGGEVQVGEVVGQRIRLGPLRIGTEVEITEVRSDDEAIVISCRTRPGHLIDGVKTYEVRREEIRMTSRSRPEPWVLWLFAPWVRRRQARANEAVLERLVSAPPAPTSGPSDGAPSIG